MRTCSSFYILGYGITDNFDRVVNEFKKSYQLGKGYLGVLEVLRVVLMRTQVFWDDMPCI